MKRIIFLLCLSSAMFGQSGVAPAAPAGTQTQAAQSTSADELAQMRTDLDHMESLLNNMSAEIEFLHDQNLQILLRTNSQMWTILLRDLRGQLQRHERQHTAPAAPPTPAPQR